MNWKHWLKGLIGAIVGGAATAGTMAVVDSAQFNFHEGLPTLGKLLFVSGFISMCAYLKQSPVPQDDPTPVKNTATIPIVFLIGALTLTSGCNTTPLNVATKSDGVVIITVDGAMKGWHDYVVAGKATQAQIDQVHDAYIKYYNAQKIAEQALLEYLALTADEQVSQSDKVQSLATAATEASEPLINLIQLFINKKVGL